MERIIADIDVKTLTHAGEKCSKSTNSIEDWWFFLCIWLMSFDCLTFVLLYMAFVSKQPTNSHFHKCPSQTCKSNWHYFRTQFTISFGSSLQSTCNFSAKNFKCIGSLLLIKDITFYFQFIFAVENFYENRIDIKLIHWLIGTYELVWSYGNNLKSDCAQFHG